jgi:hypothetical protein
MIRKKGHKCWGGNRGVSGIPHILPKSGAVGKRTARFTALDVEKVEDLQKWIHTK